MLAAANLYAQMHGLPGSRDPSALREMLERLPRPDPQHLDPILSGDLASPELGEVAALPTPKLPPKGLVLPSV